MKLSHILPEMGFSDARIINEKDFTYLALSASGIPQPHCIFLDSEKYIPDIAGTVTMVIAAPALENQLVSEQYGLCITENPRELFFSLHNFLSAREGYRRPAFATEIGEGAAVSPLASVAGQNVRIGRQAVIEEFAVIRPDTVIGDHAIIRAGAVIGGQGFEFKRTGGAILSVEHAGGVIIGDHAEIQYNSCIDRAVYPWDDTVIGGYSKLDNLVHVGHAVKIDRNVMIVAQSGIGGRTRIKPDCWIGFGATVSNGLTVGERSRVNIGAVATRDVANDQSVTGNFAIEHTRFIQNLKKSAAD
ncbi:MAG: UDP-3-O-(3-hydroxymyristoyl)glucosamine N-acyltransferase [Oscillospiraceae bacterium]|nr:UDP-3-O-(3-hydroxymyristoyl)glucosamine N-acyltransferase [Oscillospiraceae bacterium]